LRRTLEESDNEQVRALTARIDEIEAERYQAVSKLGRTQSQLDKKAKEVEDQGKDLEQAYVDIEQREKHAEELEAMVTSLQSQVRAKDDECAGLKIAMAELRDEHTASAREIEADHEA